METGLLTQRRGPTVMQVDFAAEMKASGIDAKSEEHWLRGIISELVTYAKRLGDPTPSIECVNSVLEVSVTEWQALITEYPEKSFRADWNRVLRRAVGVLAATQEEYALYQLCRSNDPLREKHLRSLIYLGYAASQILPELETLEQETRRRGLSAKTEHLHGVIARLYQHCQQISKIKVESLGEDAGRRGY